VRQEMFAVALRRLGMSWQRTLVLQGTYDGENVLILRHVKSLYDTPTFFLGSLA
jgi:hypothetical protein